MENYASSAFYSPLIAWKIGFICASLVKSIDLPPIFRDCPLNCVSCHTKKWREGQLRYIASSLPISISVV